METLVANTPSQRNDLELKHGSRFTELMNLPYYDCIRFAIIDPMHNLFLGTPKRILQQQWIENGLISKKNLERIQQIVHSCKVPIGIGRIPNKIASNFAHLTADEWKNWTLLFSLIALQDILPNEHLQCWQKYVSACNIFCSSVLTLDDINLADELMTSFFTMAEFLYGSSFLTINTHLHLHLKKVYKDYGPCYGYWLFSFERYNYILGKYHTNNLSIEIQLMRKFIQNMHIRSMVKSDALAPEHLYIFKELLCDMSGGSASETLFGQVSHSLLHNQVYVKLLPPFVLHHFDSVSLSYLRMSYLAFLPDIDLLEVPQICRKYRNAMWCSQHLKSSNKVVTYILAKWVGEDGVVNTNSSEACAGILEYFFSQRVLVGSDHLEVNMAYVKWFQEHPSRNRYFKPVEIWYSDLFKPFGPASFIPMEHIQEICITCKVCINNEIVTAVNPIRKKIFI